MAVTRAFPWSGLLCIALAVAHGIFAWDNRERRPDLAVLSPPMDQLAREAVSFGDGQFLYRSLVLDLQNAGDGGGRVTPMGQYNFDYVMGWLRALAALDSRSHHYMLLATRYFSYSPNDADVRRLVDFIVAEATQDPQRKWYWLTQAVEMADHRLSDTEYALRISRQLAGYDFPELPVWVRMFPALLLEKLGRFDEAYVLLTDVRDRYTDKLTHEELNWVAETANRLKSHE